MRRDPPRGKQERLVMELEIAVLGVVMICAVATTGRHIWSVLFHG